MSRPEAAFHSAGVYRWIEKPAGWCIAQGRSLFLVAEGSGWSRPVGRQLFASLTGRQPINRRMKPKRKT